MSVILSLLGIVLAAAGVAAIGFGIPINEFTLGTTLILAGTTGLAGGLILIGSGGRGGRARPGHRGAQDARRSPDPPPVRPRPPSRRPAASVDRCRSGRPRSLPVSARLRQHVLPRPTSRRASGTRRRCASRVRPRQPSAAPAPSAVDVSSAAIERLRSSIPRTERPKAEPSLVADQETTSRCPPTAPGTSRRNSSGRQLSRRAARAEDCRGGSCGERGCRRLEGIAAGFSVPLEAGASRDPPREFRYLLARRTRGPARSTEPEAAPTVARGSAHRRIRQPPSKSRRWSRPRAQAAAGDCDPEIRGRRGHGLYALR